MIKQKLILKEEKDIKHSADLVGTITDFLNSGYEVASVRWRGRYATGASLRNALSVCARRIYASNSVAFQIHGDKVFLIKK